jgi:dolichyl-diphosphooligosaccharide---protein glycosyltransferase
MIASLAYFYMVASWGGYAFIINIIPIFVVFLVIIGRFSLRLYSSYSIFYVAGTLFAMQIPFVGFQAIFSSEHLASHGVFIFLQVIHYYINNLKAYVFVQYIREHIKKDSFNILIRLLVVTVISGLVVGFLYLTLTGKTRWSGRSLTLLDPTYAKKYIPIIASVSEHQATTWSSFFFDLHYLIIFTPVGLYYCYKRYNDPKLFMAIYVVLAVYFASVMVRLLLVLAPAVAVMGGIGISVIIKFFAKSIVRSVRSFTFFIALE